MIDHFGLIRVAVVEATPPRVLGALLIIAGSSSCKGSEREKGVEKYLRLLRFEAPGNGPTYEAGAQRLGRTLAETGTALVYGGGRVGLMGVVADAGLDASGEAIGSSRRHSWTARSRTPGRRICAWSARCTCARR